MVETRRMQLAEELKQAQLLAERLQAERDENEYEIRRLRAKQASLTTSLTQLRDVYDEAQNEIELQQRTINSFSDIHIQHELALDRIKLLDQQLREAHEQLSAYHAEQEFPQQHCLSLQDEMKAWEQTQNSHILMSSSRKIKKYFKLKKFIEKSKKKIAFLKKSKQSMELRRGNINLQKQTLELNSQLEEMCEKYKNTQVQIEELQLATSDLIQLSRENRNLTCHLLEEQQGIDLLDTSAVDLISPEKSSSVRRDDDGDHCAVTTPKSPHLLETTLHIDGSTADPEAARKSEQSPLSRSARRRRRRRRDRCTPRVSALHATHAAAAPAPARAPLNKQALLPSGASNELMLPLPAASPQHTRDSTVAASVWRHSCDQSAAPLAVRPPARCPINAYDVSHDSSVQASLVPVPGKETVVYSDGVGKDFGPMIAESIGLFSNSLFFYKTNTTNLRQVHTASAFYAARKGTRAKARAKKVKVEVTKVGFIPHNQRGKDKQAKIKINRHQDDSYKQISKDDVFPMKYYQWPVYTAEEAIRLHQQTHHPTMYNAPDALVFANIEFNMEAVKKNRYLDNFTRLTLLPHFFPRDEERSILVFCKGQELIKEVEAAGAALVGGSDLVKKIQEGEVKPGDYDYIIAHPGVITDLVPIRGLLKRRFPTVRTGTLDPDIGGLVKKFAAGVQYRVTKDEHQESFGHVEIPVGRLNMEVKQVAENIQALLKDLQVVRPKREGLFVTKCVIASPPATQRLKIDPFVYVDRTLSKEVQEDSDDEDEAVAATA